MHRENRRTSPAGNALGGSYLRRSSHSAEFQSRALVAYGIVELTEGIAAKMAFGRIDAP